MRWMKLEPIIQTEVSQKKKNTNTVYSHTHTHTHIYMEFRKLVTTTLCVRQQRRHEYKEENFGFCGRRPGCDDFREQH